MQSGNVIEIDFNQKLEIKINNQKPVILTDLTMSLLGINQQYQRFIEAETNQDYQASTELYIKEVRAGSIIVELVALSMPIVPLVWQGGSLSEWATYAKETIEWLLGKIDKAPKDVSKQDLKQWNNILEPVAKDNGSQLNFTVSDGGTVINQFFINSQEANAAQNSIQRQLARLDEPDDHIQKNRVMYWYQTKFDSDSHTGDKAIIEDISKKPLKVIFENNAVKEAMLGGDERFSKPWHKLAYVVDVEVQTINGVPKVYTILRYHQAHTFDPSE
ncbi:MAG: hypothetical protein CMK71_04075 [Pseudomonadaceae bacterium]|nr:hypothetical protein [Pseudomonadaceae bacterium]|tara:strand:- start:854 stop:1675 length:822 start_codon:yes stop_codon:yes gene_type:complete